MPGRLLEGADVLALVADDPSSQVAALGQLELADRPLRAELRRRSARSPAR